LKASLPDPLRLPALTLAAHAYEHNRISGLMSDRTASFWFSLLNQRYSDMPLPDLELINGIVTRSIVIDYAVQGFLSHGNATVVDLGCGFSTRFNRLRPRVNWHHLDLPEVIEHRKTMLELTPNERVIACDLTAVPPATIPLDKSMLFICEGVLNHLSRDHALALLRLLHAAWPGESIIGTVITQNGLKGAQSLASDLGLSPAMWAVEDSDDLAEFLKPSEVQRVWLLGKVSSRLGLIRPQSSDSASGLAFLATL
jgi:O-methyltransferase involved in polyketide biosynthesis